MRFGAHGQQLMAVRARTQQLPLPRDRMEFGRGSFHNPFRVGYCDGLIPGVVSTPGFDAESRWDS